MSRKPVKPAKIEAIYILRGTQIGNRELARGCYLAPQQIFTVDDKKYESVEKTAKGKTVKFKISEEDAGKLIQENAAVNVKKIKGEWVACNVYGKPLEEAIPIILVDPKKEEKKKDQPPE
ncbi:MAG: hypothetical protein KAS66_00320 [Candidatus Omnitrophica bacterium]|nr:hypothetical protein [Candidatus Omnitrophota bacterium]